MNLPKYPIFATEEKHTYGFYSDGPMGKIKKFVFYEKIGTNLYNLGFGDWDEERSEANDSSRSNNGDRDKVLATVASTAVHFTDQFPDARFSPKEARRRERGCTKWELATIYWKSTKNSR